MSIYLFITTFSYSTRHHIDGLVQDCSSKSSALALSHRYSRSCKMDDISLVHAYHQRVSSQENCNASKKYRIWWRIQWRNICMKLRYTLWNMHETKRQWQPFFKCKYIYNIFKRTRSFRYQWFRVSTHQANANKLFTFLNVKCATGDGHLESALCCVVLKIFYQLNAPQHCVEHWALSWENTDDFCHIYTIYIYLYI